MAAPTVDDLVERLRRRRVRITGPRRAVLAVLVETGSHVTAEEIHRRIRRGRGDVSASSVYRTMELLAEHGIVDHVHLGHGPAEFHLTAERHAHLLCDGCGVVIELGPDLSEPFASRVEAALGFSVDLGHFALSGRCRACRAGAP